MRSRLAALASLVLGGAACHASSSVAWPPPPAPAAVARPDPVVDARPYPPAYPVLPDAELARRTSEVSARTPGWTILLDPFGMLATATCDACTRTDPAILDVTGGDRARAEAFLAAQASLVRLDGPLVMTKFDRPSGMLYEQATSCGVAATVMVQRAQGVISVSGHMWPELPTPGAWLPDRALAAKLRARGGPPDAPMEHRYVRIARSDRGPLEVREAVCLSGASASPPCLDARTGEDLSALKAGWTLHAAGGSITRAIVRQ